MTATAQAFPTLHGRRRSRMSSLRVDTDAIRQLAEILQDTGLTEIEVSEKDSRIRVAPRPGHDPGRGGSTCTCTGSRCRRARLGACTGTCCGPGTAPWRGEEPDGRHRLSWPRSPGAPVYVAVGQPVTAGQTLLLIEAMKTFNQIKAPKAGIVSRILIASGVPVEYGEVLMVID